MAIEIDTQGAKTIIHIKGRFMFGDAYDDFKKAYSGHEFQHASERIVNMSQVEVIDSTGLAMLLEMRESLGGDKSSIKLEVPKEQIRDILNYAGFNKIFEIE